MRKDFGLISTEMLVLVCFNFSFLAGFVVAQPLLCCCRLLSERFLAQMGTRSTFLWEKCSSSFIVRNMVVKIWLL